jgi:hypothetical protein
MGFQDSSTTRVGVELPIGLTPRNFLILRKAKTEKNHKSTEVRYMAGTRPLENLRARRQPYYPLDAQQI